MSGYKFQPQESSIADAVSNAFSVLEELASECREVVDNASEGLSQTQRIQTLDETAGQLESISEPDVPEKFGEIRVTYSEGVPRSKRRGPSRSARRDNAVSALQAVVGICDEQLEPMDDEDEARTPIETLRDECQAIIDEAEGCEFPGMFG